ncbi:HpcH/HpaI aldolase/citrate lyase family protein [Tumebacillus permanentifrigoris]|uniref:Citrate lyase beta subunit n=1 Tax=Tumebacillus permanentifrigoris TaxID=378543 RepID=A0A316D8C5_9BACL|nr:HpcH/HpaI aldolase/citrate lyase family protein [Tumebacillus permanentifrigoris]PWK13099.1 citrate lyase beta subunit [Tumebacillus permanentifrigoris]
MRYFDYLSRTEELERFYKPPVSFTNSSTREILSYAVGAALYSPATRTTIADDIWKRKHQGLVSMVLDLEDAIGDHEVELAEATLFDQVDRIARYVRQGVMPSSDVPLLFIRVRNPEQVTRMIESLGEHVMWITGFFFPKFTPHNGWDYFRRLDDYNLHKAERAPVLYGSPILESAEVIYAEQRIETLMAIRAILQHFRAYVLTVRIGATDFSSLFGVRRSVDHTIYDILTIRSCIADILNVMGRVEDHFVISGPVWEYFSHHTPCTDRLDDRIIRIARQYGVHPHSLADYGLIREVLLDKENGIVGKTVIHPSQIKIVQSLSAVTYEEFVDARGILEPRNGLSGGVVKSEYANKMNEFKPHMNWARRILTKANVFGVLHENQHIHSYQPEPSQAYV